MQGITFPYNISYNYVTGLLDVLVSERYENYNSSHYLPNWGWTFFVQLLQTIMFLIMAYYFDRYFLRVRKDSNNNNANPNYYKNKYKI